MGPYLARQTVKKLIANGKDIVKSRVLVMGATFKEDVSDIRNSKVASVVDELKSFGVAVEVHDPHASNDEISHEYGFELIPEINGQYDAVIVAVNHSDYLKLEESYFKNLLSDKGVLVDVKGIYRNSIKEVEYLSL